MATEESWPAGKPFRRYAFGLEVESAIEFPGDPPSAPVSAGGKVTVRTATREVMDVRWPHDGSAIVMERHRPSGERYLTIEHSREVGYRLAAPGYGTYIVCRHGRHVLADLPGGSDWRWQRLFFAQVLPLAAALHGFALFHASAVALGERAFGFVAPSGTGKTSLTARLTASGASFVTDDVLALRPENGAILAYPGAAVLALHRKELPPATSGARARLGREIGVAGKVYVEPSPTARPVRLAALFYLRRGAPISRFEIVRRVPDPSLLLGSAFLPYVVEPQHLQAHLESCSRIAQDTPLYDLKVPPGVDSEGVAERVSEFVDAVASGI